MVFRFLSFPGASLSPEQSCRPLNLHPSICLVGMTQLGIWLGTLVVLTAPGIVATLAFLPQGVQMPSLTIGILANLVLLFILGFFAYATLYAAIGASFNNLQEAQQVASVAVVFIVAPVMVINPIINDPNSTMAVTMSLIPLFTPLVMPLRIAIEMPPAWQLALAYVLTLSFVMGMIWICARIYRVGILMYGKKLSTASRSCRPPRRTRRRPGESSRVKMPPGGLRPW